MAAELVLAGVSHRTAAIGVREGIALGSAEATALLRDLVALPDVGEALVLSTCARTELYALASDPDVAGVLRAVLARRAGLSPGQLVPQVHTARGRAAVEHLLRVSAGLESVVVGEVEILGQLRRAGELGRVAGASSQILGRLVDRAVGFGRDVRATTDVGAGRSSVSSVAVDLVLRLLPRGAGARALVVGSGEMGERTAKALHAQGFEVAIVAGRRPERAGRLAAEVAGRAVALDALVDQLAEVDVVVSCTAAPHHIVSRKALVDVVQRRAGRDLLAIDLAFPRDIDPAARGLEGLDVYDLEDIGEVIQATADRRAAAVPAVEALVGEETERRMRWLAGLEAVPTIKGLRHHSQGAVLEALRRSELSAGIADEVLLATSEAIVTRLLHTPTRRLREAAERGDPGGLSSSLRELFGLDSRPEWVSIPGAP